MDRLLNINLSQKNLWCDEKKFLSQTSSLKKNMPFRTLRNKQDVLKAAKELKDEIKLINQLEHDNISPIIKSSNQILDLPYISLRPQPVILDITDKIPTTLNISNEVIKKISNLEENIEKEDNEIQTDSFPDLELSFLNELNQKFKKDSKNKMDQDDETDDDETEDDDDDEPNFSFENPPPSPGKQFMDKQLKNLKMEKHERIAIIQKIKSTFQN